MITRKEYLKRKDKHANTLFRIKPTGVGVYVENGKEYSVKEFNDKYPIPITLTSYRKNADRTRAFLETY